jgi:hypothetical protein
VTATSVGVDRPVEWQVVAGDVVDDRLRLDLDEFDPAEVRGIEGPTTELEELAVLHPGSVIEHMFDSQPVEMAMLRASFESHRHDPHAH